MTFVDWSSNPVLGVFQHDWSSGHAMRLNSRTGTEHLTVSFLNCDGNKGVRAPEVVMSADGRK